MPKTRPSPGRCIHCLKDFVLLTWDHVLPDSWSPKGGDEIEKWQAPACKQCNKDLGRLEQNVLTKLGLCFDPKDIGVLGLLQKVLRSLNPAAGRDERDRQHRAKKLAKVLGNIKVMSELPKQGIFPNFGPNPTVEYPDYAAVQISEDEVSKISEKIIRGIAYIADKSFIEDTHEIKTFVLEEPNAAEIRQLIEEGGVVFDQRPGLVVTRRLVDNEKVSGLYRIEIWGRFRMYVSVMQKDLA